VSQDLQRALSNIRQELMATLRETIPAVVFREALILAAVRLHVIEARIRKTQNLPERRLLLDEFNQRRNTLAKGIQALRESCKRGSNDSKKELRRALP